MHLLTYGGKGWLGTYVCKWLEERGHTVYHSSVRVQPGCENDLVEEYGRIKDKVPSSAEVRVLCFIGRARGGDHKTIDYLEQPGMLKVNLYDNLVAPLILAKFSKSFRMKMGYLGTGCCLGSPGGSLYSEDAIPDFFGSSYSTVKGSTDYLMRTLFPDTVLNIRIRMPILDVNHPFDFITKIASYERVIDVENSVSVIPSLLPFLCTAMETGRTGTLNLVNPGPMSHTQMLQVYKDTVDPDFEWKTFTVEEQDKILASARSNNTLKPSFNDAPNTVDALRAALIERK